MARITSLLIGTIMFLSLSLYTVNAEYKLVWQDEFDGNNLDKSKWQIEQNCDGGGNNEMQCYTNKESNVHVKDGFLHVIAKPENYGGKRYTSGRINTKNTASWKYGRFDIRAKLPKGDYLWPALWMLPRDSVYGMWAASGEIDIMEARGQQTHQTQATLHHGSGWPNNVYTGSGEVNYPFDFSADFHIFSAIWERDQIQFLVDGKVFHTANLNRNWYGGKGANPYNANRQPFDQPFFFIINLAVGGGFFGGQSQALTTQTANNWASPDLVVDYVRVYQDNGTPVVNPVPVPVPVPVPAKTNAPSNPTPSNANDDSACSGKCGGQGCCNDQKIGVVCFDSNTYTCAADGSNGKKSLCGKGLGSCGGVCFDSNAYECASGAKIQPKGAGGNPPKASEAPAKTNAPTVPVTPVTPATPAPANNNNNVCKGGCGSGSCCDDGRSGGICFDTKSYVCALDDFNAKNYLCPRGSGACKGACFDPANYKCTGGKITQK